MARARAELLGPVAREVAIAQLLVGRPDGRGRLFLLVFAALVVGVLAVAHLAAEGVGLDGLRRVVALFSSGKSTPSSIGRCCSTTRGARSQNAANAASKTSMSSRRETIVQRSAQ